MTERTLGTVPLRRRGPRQGLRLADPKQADRHRLARQRARDIVVVIKRTASRRGASPDLPPQGGGSPRGALPGGCGTNGRALVPLLQQRFNDDGMATQGKHEGAHFEDKSVFITEGKMFNKTTMYGKTIIHGKNTRVDSV